MSIGIIRGTARLRVAVFTFAASIPVHSAWAADNSTQVASTPAAAGDNGKLEDVVVRAQKRSQKLQNVPISIQVLSAKDLAKQNILNIDDLGTKIPNVVMVLPFGPEEPQFSIRGVTETDFQPSQSSPIALYVDGIYKSVGALTSMALFDEDHVEVLRGPQGTLQGRNATGGAVNIYSAKPDLDNFSGYITGGVGNYSRKETEGAINIPLIKDKLAIRAAWTYVDVPGYIHDPSANAQNGGWLSGINDIAGRASVLYQPIEDFNAILRVNWFNSNPQNYGVYAKDIPNGQGIGITPGALSYLGIPQSLYSTSGYTRTGLGFFDSQVNDSQRRVMTNHSVNFEMNYSLTDTLKLTSITGYDQGKWDTPEDDDGTPVSVDEARYFSQVHSIQEEGRVTSSFSGPYNFIFGVLYDRESLYQNVNTLWAGYQPAVVTDPASGITHNICLESQFWTCDLRTQFTQNRTDYAAYMHNTYRITHALEAELGARYTDDAVSVQNYMGSVRWINPASRQFVPWQYFIPGPGYNPALPDYGAVTNPGTGAPTQRAGDHKWTGRAGLNYHITPDNMVYASWSLGFRGSAFNGAATFGTNTINAVAPETLTDYEIGSKNEFFNHRLQVNIGAFYYIYRNQQFAGLNENTGLSEEYNIPKVNSKGFELDATARPWRDVIVRFGGGYTYATYQAGFYTGVSIAGKDVEETPRWSFSTSVDWKLLETSYGLLDLHADGNGVTSQYYDALDSAPGEGKGYTLWNARLTASTLSGRESLSLYVQNLFNREYFTSIFNTDASLNFSYAQRGLPRTFGAQATYRF